MRMQFLELNVSLFLFLEEGNMHHSPSLEFAEETEPLFQPLQNMETLCTCEREFTESQAKKLEWFEISQKPKKMLSCNSYSKR